MTTTLDCRQWDQLSYDKYALTIKDILTLKKGQQIKVLTMDRNVWDCLTDCATGESYKPTDLLRDNWAIYIHDEDLRGKLISWEWCETNQEQIDPDQFKYDLKSPDFDFEFDIEYKKGFWYPLENGYLPQFDSQGLFQFSWPHDLNREGPDNQKQHWTTFPETTCVGWRGHCILWSKLEEMPDIVYNEGGNPF